MDTPSDRPTCTVCKGGRWDGWPVHRKDCPVAKAYRDGMMDRDEQWIAALKESGAFPGAISQTRHLRPLPSEWKKENSQ